MPGPEGIGARRIDRVDSRELVETVELTLELDRGNTRELAPLPHRGPAVQPETAPRDSGAPVLLGQRYQIERQLACGGTAVIMRALDLRHDAPPDPGPGVAIKLLRPEFRHRAASIARLQREFRQTRSLVHPCIVRHYELGCDRGIWFIAMELLTGEGLGERLRRAPRRGLPIREVLRIASACGEALAFAHDHGVTHGDVKPDNVFITASGEVRLLDFGVAPDTVPGKRGFQATGEVSPAATRGYASPEVLAGHAPEPRDDVFSLACLVSEMLVGRHAQSCRGDSLKSLVRLSIEPLTGLTLRQWSGLAAGMAGRRDRRPASMRSLMQALVADADMAFARERGPVYATLPS